VRYKAIDTDWQRGMSTNIAGGGVDGTKLPVLDLTGTGVIEGGTVDGAPAGTTAGSDANVVSVAPNDQNSAPASVRVAPREIKNIGSSGGATVRYGVDITGADAPDVDGVRFTPTSGVTSAQAKAARFQSTVTNGRIRDTNVTAMPTPAGSIVDLTSGQVLGRDNIGIPDFGTNPVAYTLLRTTDASPVNNSSSPITSTVLSAALPANTTWRFAAELYYDATTTSDAKFGWAVPSGATGKWLADGLILGTTGTSGQITRASADIGSLIGTGADGEGNTVVAKLSGVITVTAAGTFALKYAQSTASNDPVGLVMRAGSTLTLTRIA
jgi:hypothetical protein